MAAFEGLTGKLEGIIRKMKGQARIGEKDIREMSREIRLALLEADVHYKVVKDFVAGLSEKAKGQDVMDSLTPGHQVVKIVHDQLVDLLGGKAEGLIVAPKAPSVYMLCGLQGSGKTTTCAKLALHLQKNGKKVLMAACDIHRPAAVLQLVSLGKQTGTEVFVADGETSVPVIAGKALAHARKSMFDVLLLDTAGRLHIDEGLMAELHDLKKAVSPDEILLVVDSMTGQDAVQVAESFNGLLDLSGIILTKLDGDTRGGAALSVKKVTGKPVKFACVGEKPNDLETFHPERMASRILGMGDVLSLIEKASEAADLRQAGEMEKKLNIQSFTLEDFLEQLEQLRKMGPLEDLLGMIPGMNMKGMKVDEKNMVRSKAIIQSMTPRERRNPSILDARRRKRIAAGSGTSVQSVNKLLSDFDNMKRLFKTMKGKKPKSMKGFKMPF
ncbi:MAG: signal recognition particle protein [Clostridia bacterium]